LPHQPDRLLRRPGRFKGKIRLADDFNHTPEEIIGAFDGKNT